MTRSRLVSDRHVPRAPAWPLALGAAAATAALPGVARAAGGEGGSLIELNATLLVQIVNFVVLLAVLYAVAYKPLVRSLQARSSAIQDQLAEAQAAREAAQRQLVEFEAKLQTAHAEAQATRERALRDAAELKERLAAEARQEASRLLETAQAEIDQSVRRARADLRAQVGTLAVDIAERLVQRSLRGEDHEQVIQQALQRMDSA
jgi:F-type H+-transporting ATPase subunit b